MSQPSAIIARDLAKQYTVTEREAGLKAALRGIVRRSTRKVIAVEGVSFILAPGEMVGFLGPNGAGKTTTLKMLSGLLHPSNGEANVLGYVPWRREHAFLRQIALVMGQRNQLMWDIPALDSFALYQAIYGIDAQTYRHTLDELVDLLDLSHVLKKPVRTLSLGERMKCEIVAALLHRPRVLFLDEPTIGLDITIQNRVRTFISEYNQRYEATVLLTSHYMPDVEALCRRVIVIHHGHILFDGHLQGLVKRFSSHKMITVQVTDEMPDLRPYGEIVATGEGRVTLKVPKACVAEVTHRLLAEQRIADLTIEDPPIEQVIEQVFTLEAVA
jgi:ABC-2 type transport system ATP-binding protein